MRSIKFIFYLFILSCVIFFQISFAAEVFLNSGSKVIGEILEETDSLITVQTEEMGEVSIKREYVKDVVYEAEQVVAKVPSSENKLWKGEASLGYDQSDGNTKKSSLSTKLLISRKTDKDEFTLSGSTYYSSADKKMDSQKWDSLIRYAFSFGEQKRWYNFYKVEGDHDRFANIHYRITPVIGVGYWFSDEEDFKAMVEAGAGVQYTNYRDDTDSDTQAILAPRGYFEKKLFDHLTVSEDISLYPSLEDTDQYRMRSETAVTSKLNDHLSLRFSFIDDYNSSPATGTKKNDYRLITSVVHSF